MESSTRAILRLLRKGLKNDGEGLRTEENVTKQLQNCNTVSAPQYSARTDFRRLLQALTR